MQAIGQLAGGVAHDFNNQLFGIIGNAELLLESLHDEAGKLYIQNVLTSANRAADLTKKLLSFARKGKKETAVVDFHQIIKEVIMVAERSINKNISIQMTLEAKRAAIEGDAGQLQNAVLNLILNARDAMPDGGMIDVSTENLSSELILLNNIEIKNPKGQYLHIAMSDTGLGIAEELQGRIFEPFFTSKPEGTGTGMGLAAVHGTLQEHQGAVSFTSVVGSGSTFHLYLPTVESNLISSAESKSGEVKGEKQLGMRIAVVDDEEILRTMLQHVLKSEGHTVLCYSGGREALVGLSTQQKTVDLVILDMMMPDMGGVETFEHIHAAYPEVKVLLSSGYSMNNDTEKLLALGVAGFLQKPYQIKILLEKIRDI
jgi:two-component system, cell cycle sensor histidine kinase and response regulator CckA